MTNIGDLIRGGTAGVPTRLAAVATGAVLASAGVNTAPTWSVSPALTDLKLGGGAIGTSGVGVLALGPSTAPTTSPVDTVQLYTADIYAEAGSRGLVLRDERGSLTSLGATTGSNNLAVDFGSVSTVLWTSSNGASIGTATNHSVDFIQNSTVRITLSSNTYIYVTLPGLTQRVLDYGAVDSGGAGYRMLRVAN
jgi:hypothetical protein